MPCFHPITGYRVFGQTALGFNPHDSRVYCSVQVPCGQCIGCRLARASRMGIRCMHEASLYAVNQFCTMTYSPENLPAFGRLEPRHLELFNKRLRRAHEDRRLRFYACGEYGERLARPHYHALYFNLPLQDLTYWKKSASGSPIYRSEKLEKIWGLGECFVGEVTFKSAAYCARYCIDVVNGDERDSYYAINDPQTGRQLVDSETGEIMSMTRQFARMSTHPGIGAGWLEKYKEQTYAWDYVIVNGSKVAVPDYYDRLIARERPEFMESLKLDRALRAELHAADNTPERLVAREAVAVARANQYGKARY